MIPAWVAIPRARLSDPGVKLVDKSAPALRRFLSNEVHDGADTSDSMLSLSIHVGPAPITCQTPNPLEKEKEVMGLVCTMFTTLLLEMQNSVTNRYSEFAALLKVHRCLGEHRSVMLSPWLHDLAACMYLTAEVAS